MEKIVQFKTNDGKLFNSISEAKEHLDVKYTNAISGLASQLMVEIKGLEDNASPEALVKNGLFKIQTIRNFFDKNLVEFSKVLNIKTELLEELAAEDD